MAEIAFMKRTRANAWHQQSAQRSSQSGAHPHCRQCTGAFGSLHSLCMMSTKPAKCLLTWKQLVGHSVVAIRCCFCPQRHCSIDTSTQSSWMGWRRDRKGRKFNQLKSMRSFLADPSLCMYGFMAHIAHQTQFN